MSQTFGEYLLEAKIADGGMAELFLASKPGAEGWRKRLVLKRILPFYSDREEFRQLFHAEAEIATRLSHPNLVNTYDYQQIDGRLCIAQEYLDGKDLRAAVARAGGAIPWQVAAHIACEVLKALQYLHRQLPVLLHGDVTPHNIFVTYEGQVKLIDFGIVRRDEETASTSAFRGKRAYSAPEYLQGGSYDIAAELYALGVSLREAVGGSNLPEQLAEILTSACDLVATQRPENAEAMHRAFAAALAQAEISMDAAQKLTARWLTELFPLPADRQHMPLDRTEVDPATITLSQRLKPALVALPALLAALLIICWPATAQRESAPRGVVVASLHGANTIGDSAPRARHAIVGNGYLEVDSHPWSSVYLNGRFLGVTPLKKTEVPSGDYHLYMVTRDGRSVEVPLNIESGNVHRLFKKIP